MSTSLRCYQRLKGRTMNEERPEERFVRERLKNLHDIELAKVPRSNVTTFDYWLVSDGKREAAVEVKRFEPKPLPESAYDTAEELSRMATLDPKDIAAWPPLIANLGVDKAPARVGRAIHEAAKQLVPCPEPRILVFVNDCTSMDFLDFEEAFNGELVYGNDDVGRFKNTTSKKVAQGLIREEKFSIDLFVWFNRYDGRVAWSPGGVAWHAKPGPFFRFPTERGHELSKRFFKGHDIPKPDRNPNDDIPTYREMLLREAGIIKLRKTTSP
jgi:hypothetical protein